MLRVIRLWAGGARRTKLKAVHPRVVLATGGDVPAQLAALGVTVPDATPAAFVLFTDPIDMNIKTVLNTPRVAVRPHWTADLY